MKDPKDNVNSDFKVGDEVVITGNNRGLPGGDIGWNANGMKCKLLRFTDVDFIPADADILTDEQTGYWTTTIQKHDEGWNYVFNVTQFRHAEAKKALKDMRLVELRILARKEKIKNINTLSKAGLVVLLEGVPKKEEKVLVEKLAVKPAVVAKPPVVQEKSVGQRLTEMVGEHNPLCAFAFEHEGGLPTYRAYAPCHANLGYHTGVKVVNVWGQVASHYNHHVYKDEYKRFVLCLLNDLPFSHVFSTKKWEDVMKEGVRIDAKENCASKIAFSLIALREGSEFPPYALTVGTLLKLGVSPISAWVFGCSFHMKGKAFIYAPRVGGHQCLTPTYLKWDDFLRFCKEGFHVKDVLTEPSYYKVCRGGYRVTRAVGGHHSDLKGRMDTVFKELIKTKPLAFGEKPRLGMTEKELLASIAKFEEMLKS